MRDRRLEGFGGRGAIALAQGDQAQERQDVVVVQRDVGDAGGFRRGASGGQVREAETRQGQSLVAGADDPWVSGLLADPHGLARLPDRVFMPPLFDAKPRQAKESGSLSLRRSPTSRAMARDCSW